MNHVSNNNTIGNDYRAYTARPFAREEREHVEILFGGLGWRAERVIEAVFENLGYRARALPPVTKADLITGREMADIGQCCPTSFTAGNLANFLRGEKERIGGEAVTERYVYLTAGACGACRFGQYRQSYQLALKGIDLDRLRMFLLAQDELDQGAVAGGGLEFSLPLTIGALWAVLCTDVLQSAEYQTRPYEVVPGSTDAAVREGVDILCEAFRNRPHRGKGLGSLAWHISTGHFVKALRNVRGLFDKIEVDRLQPRPIVKLTGEFYVQTVEGAANYDIHNWLEMEGAEVYPAVVAVWFDYLFRMRSQMLRDHAGVTPGSRRKLLKVWALNRLYHFSYDRLRRALGNLPHALPPQDEVRRLASPYYHSRLRGGEGDMLIGKALWAHVNNKAHMICELSPFGCLPNTMSVGAMARVQGDHPDLLYAPIEIKGDAEVHALSRCQMVLSEAKSRANAEFDAALEACGLTLEQAREALRAHPDLSRATTPVPHHGCTGTGANLVHELARRGAGR